MPASTRPSPSEPASAGRPPRALTGDSAAVTEVIGYLLVFGILSLVLVMSMVSFNIAQVAARERAVELRAESAAARVAGVVVQTAVLAEQMADSSPVVAYQLDLDDQLEGYDYTIRLEPAGKATLCEADGDDLADADQICVVVTGIDVTATAPLFAAAAPADVTLCLTAVEGGTIAVLYDDVTADDANLPDDEIDPLQVAALCGAGVTDAIFLGAI